LYAFTAACFREHRTLYAFTAALHACNGTMNAFHVACFRKHGTLYAYNGALNAYDETSNACNGLLHACNPWERRAHPFSCSSRPGRLGVERLMGALRRDKGN
jgi:hypothetical protein